MRRKDSRPEVQRMRVLPIIDRLVGFFCGMGDTSAEVDSKLPNVGEASCVPNVGIQTPEFSR